MADDVGRLPLNWTTAWTQPKTYELESLKISNVLPIFIIYGVAIGLSLAVFVFEHSIQDKLEESAVSLRDLLLRFASAFTWLGRVENVIHQISRNLTEQFYSLVRDEFDL